MTIVHDVSTIHTSGILNLNTAICKNCHEILERSKGDLFIEHCGMYADRGASFKGKSRWQALEEPLSPEMMLCSSEEIQHKLAHRN